MLGCVSLHGLYAGVPCHSVACILGYMLLRGLHAGLCVAPWPLSGVLLKHPLMVHIIGPQFTLKDNEMLMAQSDNTLGMKLR